MQSLANTEAFHLVWSGMLVVLTLAALAMMSWHEKRARHSHRRRPRSHR
jgi:uncharacterized membrane protein YsdA (DUF1294 family)